MRQAIAARVEVSQRGREVTVAQQALQRRQVGAGLQQVCGVAVPQRVDRRRLPQARLASGLLEGALQGGGVEGAPGRPGEQPVRVAMPSPVVPQLLK